MKTVPLSGKKALGRVALVDDEDYELVMPYRWNVMEFPAGRRIAGPYAVTYARVNGKSASKLMHSLITGWPLTDHHDHNTLNNQRYNLRAATTAQNQANRRPMLGGSSAYKGVSWRRNRQTWRAAIKVHYVSRHLGHFATEEEAALAYNVAATEAFGEFALLNEVPTGK